MVKKKRPYKGEDYMKNRALLGSIAMEIMKACKDCNPKLRAAIFIKNQENVKDNKIDLNEVAAYGGYFHSIHDVNEFLMIMSVLLKNQLATMSEDDFVAIQSNQTLLMNTFGDILKKEDLDKTTYKDILLSGEEGKEK